LVATDGLGHNRVMWEPEVVRRAVSFATLTTAAERDLRDPWRRFLFGGYRAEHPANSDRDTTRERVGAESL
jgi:hypothetical protein